MSEKMSRNEVLIFKKLLTAKDKSEFDIYANQLGLEITNRLGETKRNEIHSDMIKQKEKYGNDPQIVSIAKTADSLRKKMAAALTDDEFIEWVENNCQTMVGAVQLSPREMELIKGGLTIGNAVHSFITFLVGCGLSYYMGECGLYKRE